MKLTPPPPPPQPRARWPWVAGGVLVLAVAAVTAAAGLFIVARHGNPEPAPVTWPGPEYATIEQTARVSVVALLSYEPDTARQSLTKAADNLTGQFRDTYTKLINDTVIPGAEKKRIISKVTVPGIGTSAADDTTATVLVFVNQSITAGSDAPTETASSVRLHLVKKDGRWLIDQFDPLQ